MPIKFGDRLVNINPDYAVIDLTDNQSLGVFFFNTGIKNANLLNVPSDKRAFGMLGVDVLYNKVYIYTGSTIGHLADGVFDIAPIDDAGVVDNTEAPDGENGGTYWKEIGTIERRFDDIGVAIADGKTFGKYSNDYQHPSYPDYVGEIPVTQIGGGAGMTALEIIIEALTEAQPLEPTLSVIDSTYPNTNQTFPFGVTGGNVSATVSVTNINSGLFDTNGDPVTLDTTEGASCVLYYRDAVAPGQTNNNAWTSMGNIALSLGGGVQFGGSDTFAWTNTPQEWDEFYGFEYKVEVEDSYGMAGEATDSINVSNYIRPTVTGNAERITDMSGIYASNETDGRRIRGNTNTRVTFNITPQQQDGGGADTIIPVQNWKLYRSVTSTTSTLNLDSVHLSTSGWTEIATGSLGNSVTAVNGITYNDFECPDDASSVAYMVVVQDSFLSTSSAALDYYQDFTYPGGSTVSASTLLQTGQGGSNRFIQFQFPFFVGYANINGSTYDGNSNVVNSNFGINEYGGVPDTFIENGGSEFSITWEGTTYTGSTGLLYDMNQFFGPQVDTSSFNSTGVDALDTFESISSVQVTGNNRLILAVADPLGSSGTPPEISYLEFSNSPGNNQIGAFSSTTEEVTVFAGPTNGNENTPQSATYRIYVANQVAAPSAQVNISLTLPNN